MLHGFHLFATLKFGGHYDSGYAQHISQSRDVHFLPFFFVKYVAQAQPDYLEKIWDNWF